jgi:predicted dehydrogenase
MNLFGRRHALKVFGSAVALPSLVSSANVMAQVKTKKPRIMIGQIGVGHAHANKLSVYRASDDYEVVGIVEPDERLRERAAQQAVYQDLPWMTEEQLLNVSGLQAVLVETEVRDLLQVGAKCIAAGKHIHLDKPAGESLPEFRQLLDDAARQKLMVQLGYMYRYSPAVVLLREFLKAGWLGEPFEVHAVMSKAIDAGTRQQLGEYPGGTMFELGCHIIDLVIGVLGKPTKVNAYPQRVIEAEDQLVDNMLAVFEYPKALATVKSTGLEVEGFERRHLVVCGTEGTFLIQPLDSPAARVSFSKARGDYKKGTQAIAFPKFPRYVADAADMASVLRGESKFAFSYAHDLDVQTAVLQASGLPIDK